MFLFADSFFSLIYDLEVKQSSPVHLGVNKLMNQMHYLLLKKHGPEQKQRFGSKTLKHSTFRATDAFPPCPLYSAHQPEACASFNIG